ncbi:MAG TPA: molybdopterin-dependent oxidoreductase, partial [Syntrophorhabdaceae bacterium]|nr:molybdopterin-dependent oxidoreductase [Syntrophorhabdaceae bacterium]
VYYRNFPVEKYDPFYDRDYNLCILCGRCIRVCNDIRLNGTLSFKQRGQQTTIGPAFDRTHLEGGCEFCGACVNVCPTGTLSVKTGKWYGKPDKEKETVCNFCSIGCKLVIQAKNDSIVDSLPDYDSPLDKGLICVKGRFCITEYVHSPIRYGTPMEMTPVGYNNITWERAIEMAAEKIKGVKPDEILMIISAQLLNEDIYCAQKFIRDIIGSQHIVPAPLLYLNNDFPTYWNLCVASRPLNTIEEAEFIFTIGFDSTYGYSPIGIRVKEAAKKGTYLVTLRDRESNLDLWANSSFQIEKKTWYDVIEMLTSSDGAKEKHGAVKKTLKEKVQHFDLDLDGIKRSLSKAKDRLIILGQEILNHPERSRLFEKLEEVIQKGAWKIIVASPFTNLKGTVMLGGLPHVMPGDILKGRVAEKVKTVKASILNFDLNKKRRLIYIIGDAPHIKLPECDFLIYQNAIPASFEKRPDLILPSALFPETEGTFINTEDSVLRVKKVIEPHMESKPDWWIIGAIGERLKKGRFKCKDIPSIHGEIKKVIKGFPKIKDRLEFLMISTMGSKKTGRFIPVPEAKRAVFRGIALSDVVSGMKVIERSTDE